MTDDVQGQLIPMRDADVEDIAARLEAAVRDARDAEDEYVEARTQRKNTREKVARLLGVWTEARYLARDGTRQEQQAFQQKLTTELEDLLRKQEDTDAEEDAS